MNTHNTGDITISDTGVTSIYNGSEYVDISTTVPIVSFEEGLKKYNLTEKELFKMLQKHYPEKLL